MTSMNNNAVNDDSFRLNNDAVLLLRDSASCCQQPLHQQQQQQQQQEDHGIARLKQSVALLDFRLRQLFFTSSSLPQHQQQHSHSRRATTRNVQVAFVSSCSNPQTTTTGTPAHIDIFQNYFLLFAPKTTSDQQEQEQEHRSPVVAQEQQRQSTAACLAVSLYNLALSRQLKHKKGLIPDSDLLKVATLYESAFGLLSHQPVQIQVQDSLAVVALAICTNLCALYLELGDLTKVREWQNQLNHDQFTSSLRYHQARYRQHARGQPNRSLQCIQITASMQGFLFASGAA